MRIRHFGISSIVALASVAMARAQGSFENLNFEEANIVPITGQPLAITVANALPGWTVDYGTDQQSQIFYNDASLGAAQVTLFANGSPGILGPIIDGNFSVLLQPGAFNGAFADASISQTAQVPQGTQSLLFDAYAGPPEVLLGNDQLSLFPVGSGQGVSTSYTIYGANISAWAGQTEQLTFSSPLANILIDDISFSPNATVPEPTPLALAGIGTALFAIYRRCYTMRR
jgi:hypothetical protein